MQKDALARNGNIPKLSSRMPEDVVSTASQRAYL
jgi:hypothetical protein